MTEVGRIERGSQSDQRRRRYPTIAPAPNGKWGPVSPPAPTSSSSRSSARSPYGGRARPFVSASLGTLATGGRGTSLPPSAGLRGRSEALARPVRLRRRIGRRSGASSVPAALAGIGRLIRTGVSGALASPAFPPSSPLPATPGSSHASLSRASGKSAFGPVDNEDNGDKSRPEIARLRAARGRSAQAAGMGRFCVRPTRSPAKSARAPGTAARLGD
jgi:hypothetical protein